MLLSSRKGINNKNMKITLCSIDNDLIDAWRNAFVDQTGISIIKGDITKLKCDAMASPANSFGFMDGGIDFDISVRFGWDLQKKLQQTIILLPEGELLVGQAIILETGDKHVPYLISAPTMRVPMDFNIGTSVNAYHAMKAILIIAKNHHAINSIVIPGLCTGTGKMNPMVAAKQMRAAFNEIILEHRRSFADFEAAQAYQIFLNHEGRIYDSYTLPALN